MNSKILGTSNQAGHLPDEVVSAIHEMYEPAGLKAADVMREPESLEYKACRLTLNGQNIVFRVAKTTPAKLGQFVTIWQRLTPDAEIIPFDISDNISFVVVCVFDAIHQGQFVFDQKILLAKDIISRNGNGGKRAIRVYPPWIKPIAKEAIETQLWQLSYFLPIKQDNIVDLNKVRKLFNT